MSFAIEMSGVTKTYGSGATAYQALKGVDLAVRAGEVVMLCGPSGSGKTTVLSILGCVLSPSSGSVRLLDREIARAREKELPALRLSMIGFVFQSHNLLASLSAQENVAMLLELRGVARKRALEEAAVLLGQVGLADKLESRPRDLSIGQRQRVAIARALAGRPPILLADEPTAALDAKNGLAITETLRSLAKEHGHTVLIVTHDNRIFHLADRIVHIEDGRIIRHEGSVS
jgi:putative ABC transport system ATP-binding protein